MGRDIMTEHNLPFNRRSRSVAAAIFLAITLALICAGYLYYRAETTEIIRDKYQTLASISELKAQQIAQWRHERLSEAVRVAGDPAVAGLLEDCLRSPGDEGLRSKLSEGLKREVFEEGHSGSLVFDAESNILVANDDAGTLVSEATRSAMCDALATGRAGFSDFYFGPTGAAHLDVVVPVKNGAGDLLGGVILRHEADDFLFPMAEAWPVPTHSAETIFIERDGDDALFVNEKGHKPLTRRIPLTKSDIPAVQVVLGKRGIFGGRDYRGVEVIGDLVSIPGSPWFLEVKVDAEEIFAEARARAVFIFIVVGLLVLTTGVMVMAFYRNRQARIMAGLLEAERHKAAALEEAGKVAARHRDIIQTATDGYCMVDMQARILEVNEAFCTMHGYDEQELLAMNISELEAGLSPEEIAANIRIIVERGQHRFETRHRCRDGRTFDVDISIHHRPSEGVMVAFHRDITDRKRMIEDLKTSEAKFRDVIEASPIAMAGIDAGMQAVFLNPEFVRTFGYTKEDLPALSQWWELAYPDPLYRKSLADAWHASLERLEQTGGGGPIFDVVVRYKDGTDKNVLISTARLHASKDHGYVVSLVDITGRKLAEEELQKREARFRSYFEMPLHGNCITSIEKGWLEVNERLCEMLGYTREEIVQKNWAEMTHPDDLAADVEHFDRLLAGKIEQYKLEKRFIRRDGTFVWTLISVGCVRKSDGSVDHVLCIIEDISRRKHDEQLLEEHAIALRRTNEELNQSLHAARELAVRAEAAARAKSEFLAVMSHELRTPLNGVLGFSELLATTSLNAEQQDFARTIRDSGEHLLAIVNDILDFSSIEKGTMALESVPITLSKLVESSSLLIRKTAADKGVEFRCEMAPGVPDRITGDERRIRQILINLLGNAVKFTSEGSVVLRVSAASTGGLDVLDFAVADTGPGISPETLTCLFQPFTQADSTLHRGFEGTGLGLAISQKLAETMGGTITVDSKPGKGSRFTFRLPVDPTNPAVCPLAHETAVPEASHFDGLVLVVEDDRVNSKLAGNLLRSLGCRVEFASNGQEAVEACEKGRFSAVFMDMQMPVLDGIDATKLIRRQENGNGRVPIIALTANVMPGDREKCLSAGMDGFLTKPFKKAEFATALACHLAHKD